MPAPVLFSVAPDYYRSAVATLRRELDVEQVRKVGEDAGLVRLRGGGLEPVAGICREGYLPFIRHLAGVAKASGTAQLVGRTAEELAQWALDAVIDDLDVGDEISLHVWDSGEVPWAPGKIRRPLLESLMDNGIRVVTVGAARALDVCIGSELSTSGLTPAGLSLVDWAGGRMRLATRKEQVSRAEFKLEELFTFIEPLRARSAVDLGASPGGWTRILRSQGVQHVHSVDPAQLHERIVADPGVTHHRTTAGEFVSSYDEQVDLIVNDMRMVPQLTAHTMVDAAKLLPHGGTAIVTLKLGTNNPVKQWDDAMEILVEAYEPTFIRQLQHNRHELTVVLRKR